MSSQPGRFHQDKTRVCKWLGVLCPLNRHGYMRAKRQRRRRKAILTRTLNNNTCLTYLTSAARCVSSGGHNEVSLTSTNIWVSLRWVRHHEDPCRWPHHAQPSCKWRSLSVNIIIIIINTQNNKIQTHERFKRTLYIRTKHNLQIFGIIPFIKQQNDT